MALFESDWMNAIANQVVSGVNSALAMSPGSQKQLKNLEGSVLKVQISGLDSALYFGIVQTSQQAELSKPDKNESKYQIYLLKQADSADVTITGSPLSFTKLISQKNKAALFQNKAFILEGDAVRIQQILVFLGSLKIDWDGLLARFIGDVPAHLLGSTMRSGLTWGLNISQSLIRDMEEFIKYELRLLPDSKRAKNQFSVINALSDEVDQLSQRFDQLEANANK